MDEYYNNSEMSKKSKEQQAVVKKFTAPSDSSDISVKTETVTKSVFKNFFAADLPTVWDSVLVEVIAPWLKRGLLDTIISSATTWLYEGQRPSESVTTWSSKTEATDYNAVSKNKSLSVSTTTKIIDPSTVIFKTWAKAEVKLSQFRESLGQYSCVSIGDWCDLCGVDCDYPAYNYGWTNLEKAQILPCSEGFYISFPAAKPLSR